MRIALIVEYEGTGYSGLQYQPNAPSIQEELEKAIERLTGESVRVSAAGRTDAGVHARGQVVSFLTGSRHTPETFLQALNHYLPEQIAVRAAYGVCEGFDPRRNAMSRVYAYTLYVSPTRAPLLRRTALRVGGPLVLDRMRRGARLFEGAHDFAQFSGPLPEPGASTVRRISGTSVRGCGNIVTIEIEGNAFLPHMVRRMAGALVALGSGKMSMDDIRAMIDRRPRAPAGHALPAHGLSLEQVKYAGFPPEDGEQDGDN